MRFVMYAARAPRPGLLDGEEILDLQALHRRLPPRERRKAAAAVESDLIGFIAHGSASLGGRLLTVARALSGRERRTVARSLARTRLLPPIRPRKNIFCMGRNYAAHARESG